MQFLLLALAQVLVVSLNVRVSEGAPPKPSPVGAISLTVPCGDTDKLTDSLESKYRERVVFKGISNGGIMKFYANDKTSTFTVAVETGSVTCIVMAGNFLIKQIDGQPL